MSSFRNNSVSHNGMGYLHEPASPTGNGMVLTHGAGSNCQSDLLLAVAHAFTSSGTHVLRYELPFRQERPSGPPRGSSAKDRDGLAAAVRELRGICRVVYLAGHSYGGRQASILAAGEPEICDGLLLLSYPLHPPKQPEKLRTGHFPELITPALFVHGTKDPFGSYEELSSATKNIPALTAIMMVESAGHDLRKGSFDIAGRVIEPWHQLLNGKRATQ